MIKPLQRQLILEPTDRLFESEAVLNPAVYYENGLTHLFYRACAPGNYSSIGYALLRDDQVLYRSPEPILFPESAAESHGIEDPRIVRLKNQYYLFYTVYDGTDAQVAYAIADELPHFKKQRIISPPFTYGEVADMCSRGELHNYLCQTSLRSHHPEEFFWDKDAFIFPEYIHGKLAMIHRLLPEIQLSYFNSFDQLNRKYWNQYLTEIESHTLMESKFPFESSYIGGGVPPIRTEAGWLFIYHAVEQGKSGPVYRAAAALLDLQIPLAVRGRLPYPLFEPMEEWEKNGVVNNVVFPTGAMVTGDVLQIFYGAADKRIGRVTFNLPELLNELTKEEYA